MKNYKLTIAYDGTRYRGWQSQGNTEQTIQGKLQALFSRLAGRETEVHGSGRTDAGVHARGQVANVKLDTAMTCQELKEYCNHYLPEDIGILDVTEAPERFHARLNAKTKCYVYRIWNSSEPCIFERRYVTRIPQPLDAEAMERAAGYLTGTHDFRSFCGLR
ncbi:MAG: tRNA pseudouridine(38-40) synthase TruA, partial [Oscillospiraceae bacterium]|nr:tRNA pseudouridine(38-40) synthase TruA [Oscillospiraceae bacterium]